MQAIPDKHARRNVNLKQLEKSKSQSELLWNLDTDTFGHKISMTEKPLSKRDMVSELSSVYDTLELVAPLLLHEEKSSK